MDGAQLTCVRHGNPTRITCVTCATPICPDCAIRTPVGYKCPDHATRPPVPGRSRATIIAVPLLVLGLLGLFQVARSTGRGEPAKPPCPTETAPDVGIGGKGGTHWREMPPSGLCGRYGAAGVWTGAELVVWGGENCAGASCPTIDAPHLADGAAYNPARDAWRTLAPSPLAKRAPAATAWTGTEMLVWGGVNEDGFLADGAAYDPARDRWRAIASGPLAGRDAVASVWTERELVVWGGGDRGDGFVDGAAYDPAADRWRSIADAPLSRRARAYAAWTGREMVVWGGVDPVAGAELRDGAAYDPATNRWRTIAGAPIAGRDDAASVWTGRELVVWGGSTVDASTLFADGAAYNPATDGWRRLPDAPLAGRLSPGATWSGREMLVWGGIGQPAAGGRALDRVLEPRTALVPIADGAAYDPVADRWRPLEPVPLLGRGAPIVAWDGREMLLWGGLVIVSSPASSAEGVRYTP